MASSSSKKINVKCSDDHVMVVEEALVDAYPTMKHFIEEKCSENEKLITLPDISSKTLSKIIEFIKVDLDIDATLNDVGGNVERKASNTRTLFCSRNPEFAKVDKDTLVNLIMGACYLKIEKLVDLGCQEVAKRIEGFTFEQIREIFNIKNDYTPDEAEEIHKWLASWFND